MAISFSALILASACAQSGTTTTSAAPSAAKSAAASGGAAFKRGDGGELKILYWQAPTILNPHQATGTKDSDASRLVIEPLASWGPDAKPIANGLAAEVPTVANGGVSADFTTVTWKLKPNLKWSDGSAVTADDVVFTFNLIKDPASASTTSDNTEGVKSVVAKDANTVVITYDAPNPNFYQWGVGTCCGILQKKQFSDYTGAKLKDAPGNLKPIGTGPYMVTDFKPGDVVSYAANPNFRDPNKPYFKTVSFKGGGDAESAARALFQTGDVDYAWNLQVAANILKPMIAQSTKGTMLSVYGSSVERILVNFADPNAPGDQRGEPTTKHPFFNGPDGLTVRKALAMATDRKTVAEQLYGDGLTGKPGCNIITGIPEYESTATQSFCNTFDPVAAGKMLDDAGWKLGSDNVRAKNGIKLKVVFSTTVNAVRQATQAIEKAAWEKAGFGVELKQVPAATFFTNTSPDGANHFWTDLEMFTNNSDPDPTSYLNGWTTKQIAQKSNNWQTGNYNRYSDPTFDGYIDQLRKETDPAKRADLIKKANDNLILNVVIIPIVTRTQVTSAISKTIKGDTPTGWDSEMYNIQDWYK
ncbi:MAG TPA: peptide ABC transporter substrate-binding protein [Candidatus Limnocylindria bacterium]|nr:peptide ABC transporter substrate-binding protein [Candidatus Limnocylindria bacterium]